MSDKTLIRRQPERTVIDQATIDSILDEGFVCHAGYVTHGIVTDRSDRAGARRGSAKVRSGDPADDPTDLDADVWAGVVPISLAFGEAVPDRDLRPGIELPDYPRPYRR